MPLEQVGQVLLLSSSSLLTFFRSANRRIKIEGEGPVAKVTQVHPGQSYSWSPVGNGFVVLVCQPLQYPKHPEKRVRNREGEDL